MGLITTLVDFILHIDQHLGGIIHDYGAITYLLLFLIIFCETGLVVTPFLPGDSLLFAAGAFAALGSLNIGFLFFMFAVAAIVGDALNYSIGKKIGSSLMAKEKHRFIKPENIQQTVDFFERHGGKTIVIARFIPIIRTFAPFVAGTGKMEYHRFFQFNALGGLLWVSIFTFGGYFFGNLSFVKNNFSVIIIAIVVISFVPAVIMHFKTRKKETPEE